jgi:hypothetical protein
MEKYNNLLALLIGIIIGIFIFKFITSNNIVVIKNN